MSDQIGKLAEMLERQKKQVATLEKEIRTSKEHIKTLEGFRSVMEDVQSINAMSRRKLKTSGVDEVPQMTDSIPELILRIHELENAHTHSRERKGALEGSVKTLEGQLALKQDQFHNLQREVLAIKGYTCWNMRKMHKENSFEAENHAMALEAELQKLREGNHTLEQSNAVQTTLIGELTSEVQDNLRLPDDFASVIDLLDSKQKELAELEEEIARENRLSAQKERITIQKRSIRDPVRHYDSKKRILQNDVKRTTETRRLEEKNILAQRNAIAQSIEKARAMVDILKQHIPKGSQADGAAADGGFFPKQSDLLKVIEDVRTNADQAREVDQKLEKAIDDIAIIEKARISAAKRHAQASKARLEEILTLESDIETRDRAYKNQKKQLQRDNEVLAQEVQRKLNLRC